MPFRVLREGFDETSGDLGLIGPGCRSGLAGERLNHVHNSHGIHLEDMVGPFAGRLCCWLLKIQ